MISAMKAPSFEKGEEHVPQGEDSRISELTGITYIGLFSFNENYTRLK